MPVGKKIRIYDLARDLKQDAKRVLEDLRREGADVSVPSNSVSAELAEKVRLRYFPKADVAPKRAIKVIKAKAVRKEELPEQAEEAAAPEVISEQPEVTSVPEIVPETPDESAKTAPAKVLKVLKKRPAAQPEPISAAAAEP